MPRGKKTCENCAHESGPRAYVCANCNTPFIFKVKSKEQKSTKFIRDFNWKELQKGDRIKTAGGPYFMKGSEFIPMGYRGRFTVVNLDKNGIVAYSEKGGYCHIYMGADYQDQETKIWKIKHKLIKLKNKAI